MSDILVLVGHKGAGKDAAIQGLPHTNVKMAGALKQMLRYAYGAMGYNPTIIEQMVEGQFKEDPGFGVARARFNNRGYLFEMLLGLVEYQVGDEDKAWQILTDFETQPCEYLCGMSSSQMLDSLRDGWLPHLKIIGTQNTPRWLMQTLGTEWGRKSVHPDLWTKIAKRRAEMLLAQGKKVVITDARFPNEIEVMREIGAKVVRIDRPGLLVDLSHESEAHIPSLPIDQVVLNNGTLEELRTKLHTI